MVCLCYRRSRSTLNRIKTAHIAGIGIPALCEISRIARHSREAAIKEVRVERDDYVGGIELVSGLDRLAKGHSRAFIDVVAIDRLVQMPVGFGKRLDQLLLLVGKRRR